MNYTFIKDGTDIVKATQNLSIRLFMMIAHILTLYIN